MDGVRTMFASGPGVLHAVDKATARVASYLVVGTTPIRLRHNPLLPTYLGPAVTGVHSGRFAETNVAGRHLRIWQTLQSVADVELLTGAAYTSGLLPEDVNSVAGLEPDLFGVDGRGRVVRMSQEVPAGWDCAQLVSTPWLVVDRSAGVYKRVVVPTTVRGVPVVADLPPTGIDCPMAAAPWEWQ